MRRARRVGPLPRRCSSGNRGIPRLPLARQGRLARDVRKPLPASASADQQLLGALRRPRRRTRRLHRQLRTLRRFGHRDAPVRIRPRNLAWSRAGRDQLPGRAPWLDRLGTQVARDERRRTALAGPRARAVILGLETSCDETAAALISRDGRALANVVSSQAELHARYGGVVPEVASRRHLELVTPVIREALGEARVELRDVELVAVTTGPGLIGALLVGVAAAKAIAWARRLPLAAVDHLHGHVASLYLEPDPLEPPFLCLLASGGHTLLLDVQDRGSKPRVLGTTIDDAAGEAFDKGARLLGLGYPGGAEIDRLARSGDPHAYDFPIARVAGLDFSFSGLKTALLYAVRRLDATELEARRADLAASYQRAIVLALTRRLREAAAEAGIERIAVVGGVAANSELRAALPDAALAPLSLCTDNAAMIASAARYCEALPPPRYLALDAHAG